MGINWILIPIIFYLLFFIRSKSFLELIFIGSVLFLELIPGNIQLERGFPWHGAIDPAPVTIALYSLSMTLGLVFFLLGSRSKRRKSTTENFGTAPPKKAHIGLASSIILALVMAGVFFWYVDFRGGVANLLLPRGAIEELTYVSSERFITFFYVGFAATYARFALQNRSPILLVTAIVQLILVAFPVALPRYVVLCAYIYAFSPLLLPRLSVLKVYGPPVSIAVVSLFSQVRYGIVEWGEVSLSVLQNGDFGSAYFSLHVIERIGQLDISYGWLLISSSVLSIVPRALLPSKHEGSGVLISDDLGSGFSNIGVPPLAELVIDFGLLGIFVYWLVAFAWGRLRLNNEYMLVIICFTPILVRGALLSVVAPIIMFLLATFVFHTFFWPRFAKRD